MKPHLLFLLIFMVPRLLIAQQSTLQVHSYHSTQLGRDVQYYILLPPGYETSSDRYPVLYMLRGAEWEWITRTQDGSRGGRDLQTIVDDLYTRGKIGKMIYVMPGLSQPGTDPELTAMAYEMFPYIDSTYRTVPTRWHRGVDGFSYGGLDEMNVVSIRPDAFGTAGSYDGSFFVFDFSRVLSVSAEQAHKLAGIRFMHHSGVNAGGITNYVYVRQLVDSMAARGWKNEFPEIQLAPNAVHNWWFADEHMLVTLPLHWNTFNHPPQSIQAQLAAPVPGARLAGTVNVQWSVLNAPTGSRLFLDCSADKGKSWHGLFSGPASTSSFVWNTTTIPDGAWYLLRLSAAADTAYGQAELSAPFTIDNPGNGAPSVEILSLAPRDTVSGQTLVQWDASDPEGDSLTFALDISSDGGHAWEPLASGLRETSQYLWDSRRSPNSTSAALRIRCTDGQSSVEATIGGLLVRNERSSLAPPLVSHRSGRGDGTVIPHITDSSKVLQHNYQVTFSDSGGRAARFSVTDLTSRVPLVDRAPILGAGSESQEFQGIRLEIAQPERPTYSPDSSRWLKGASTLMPLVTLPQFIVGDSVVRGTPYPADYLITVSDRIVDTSSADFGASPGPMKFTVWNATENRMVPVVFGDQNGDAQIGSNDEIVILESGPTGTPVPTWDLLFRSASEPVPPQGGDVYLLRILKPFSSRDTLEFAPVITAIAQRPGPRAPERFALYQNYPNPFNPATTIRYALPRRLHVTIAVFNILGQQVAELFKGAVDAGYHEVQFDAGNLASGVYFCRLSAVPLAPRDLTPGAARGEEAGSLTDVKKLVLMR